MEIKENIIIKKSELEKFKLLFLIIILFFIHKIHNNFIYFILIIKINEH